MSHYNTFCMFIGYPRSGHSLIGAFLNAHPEILISHEYDVVKQIANGKNMDSIYKGIKSRNKWFQGKENEWNGYSYEIPNQHQSKVSGYDIIGDKKGGRTTDRFLHDNTLISTTLEKIPLEIKWVHVLRNPFDIISTMTRYKGSIELNMGLFIKYHETFQLLKSKVKQQNIITIYHEELFENPKTLLKKLLDFFNKKGTAEYFNDCVSVLFKKQHKTKKEIFWSNENEEKLVSFMSKHIELHCYL